MFYVCDETQFMQDAITDSLSSRPMGFPPTLFNIPLHGNSIIDFW